MILPCKFETALLRDCGRDATALVSWTYPIIGNAYPSTLVNWLPTCDFHRALLLVELHLDCTTDLIGYEAVPVNPSVHAGAPA